MKPAVLILILAFILFIGIFPAIAASEELCIENGTFESEHMLWSYGAISASFPYAEKNCMEVASAGEKVNGLFCFYTEYQKSVLLSKDSIYEISFYVRTDSTENAYVPKFHVDIPAEKKQVQLKLTSISSAWQKISAAFMVDQTDYYTFSIETFLAESDVKLFIDDVTLSKVDFDPVGIDLAGNRTVTIPDAGTATYSYVPIVLDRDFSSYPIHSCALAAQRSLPLGVSFDSTTGVLSVEHTALPDQYITLSCSIFEGASVSSVFVQISLSKNVLQNGNFDDFPKHNGWNMDETPFSLNSDTDFFAQIPIYMLQENVYTGSLSPSHATVLYASHLYVFRAKVRSDVPYTARNMRADVLGPNNDNLIRFQISNISGKQWNEVAVAFRVPKDGIYSLILDFISSYDYPVYVDDIVIQPEEVAPMSIYYDTPMQITRPMEGDIQTPLVATVLNQMGIPQEKAVSFAVTPENPAVRIVEGNLVVSATAPCQEYTIVAFLKDNPNVQSQRTMQISNESVCDGSFEKTEPGQAWVTALPSALHYVSTYKDIYPADGKQLARLTMNGAVSMVISDSLNRYDQKNSYVFEADMSMLVPDIDTVVTVLVDNAHSESFNDNLVIGQFSLSKQEKHIQHLFSPTESVTGRLMIAFNTAETHDQQVIFMDKISVIPAAVYAYSVLISGSPYLDKNIIGNYRFSSNFNAADASTYRWLISDTPNGIFMPIAGENDSVLSITSSMLHKYVKFEVTPISLSGPVVGDSVASGAILIGEPISSGSKNEITQPEVSSPQPTPQNPEEIIETQKAQLHAIDIKRFSASENDLFFDLENHWAKTDVELLTSAGLLQGRGNGLFEPEEQITRAEFSAVLARAFQLAPIYYDNLFSDVKGSHWYAGAVAVVTKYGVAQGTSQNTFSPDLPISREEMAVMIMRAYRKTAATEKVASLSYVDQAQISSWAIKDILDAGALGIINGFPDGSFLPKENATRAEAAVVIRRMLFCITENTN